MRRYKVVLDGTVIGEIAAGKSETFVVAPGDHTIQLKIDWCSTPELLFRAADEPVIFECFSKLRGPRLLLACLAIFNGRGWIGIRRLEDGKGIEMGEQGGAGNGRPTGARP